MRSSLFALCAAMTMSLLAPSTAWAKPFVDGKNGKKSSHASGYLEYNYGVKGSVQKIV